MRNAALCGEDPRVSAQGATRLLATAQNRYLSVADHTVRMSRYTKAIADQLGLEAGRAQMLRGASKLHDIGKLAIPDRILLKPTRLTASEWAVLERHTTIGHELLSDSGSEQLDVAASIALSHHERWDGQGYPHGLRGEEIPLEVRIATVADVFDALTRIRPYRPAFKVAEAFELIQAGRETQFDPAVVDAFLSAGLEIRRLRRGAARI
jgi:HD-GYP domain-containing protein (c-di-GMP phosphodiesterase class II)